MGRLFDYGGYDDNINAHVTTERPTVDPDWPLDSSVRRCEAAMNYKLAYAIGFHPWETALDNDQFVETITTLFAEVEHERGSPFGRALDIGTGSGIWGVELARRGWDVTGVDHVEKALHRAAKRVAGAGEEMALILGDVTDLEAAGVEGPFHLVLDTGTFHGLSADKREAMGRSVDRVAAADATVLMLAWEPRRRGPLPRGADREEIQRAFPEWSVTDLGRTSFEAPKPVEVLANPNEHWYRLQRR